MKSLSPKKDFLAAAQAQTVEYLLPEEVYAIADFVRNESPRRPGRNGLAQEGRSLTKKESPRAVIRGERNSLLILTLFETGLRISEALSITPARILRWSPNPDEHQGIGQQYNGGYAINIIGKGRKPRTIACPEALADKLNAFAYKRKLGQDDRIFNIKRAMAWVMINKAAKAAGITKRIYPHLFRHSDAIERLRQTGNPKALQLHLGHSSIKMTMRYLSTLSQEDAVKINQQVRFEK